MIYSLSIVMSVMVGGWLVDTVTVEHGGRAILILPAYGQPFYQANQYLVEVASSDVPIQVPPMSNNNNININNFYISTTSL